MAQADLKNSILKVSRFPSFKSCVHVHKHCLQVQNHKINIGTSLFSAGLTLLSYVV